MKTFSLILSFRLHQNNEIKWYNEIFFESEDLSRDLENDLKEGNACENSKLQDV